MEQCVRVIWSRAGQRTEWPLIDDIDLFRIAWNVKFAQQLEECHLTTTLFINTFDLSFVTKLNEWSIDRVKTHCGMEANAK